MGTVLTETPDGLVIRPRPLHGGVFHTYDDHRLATAGALLGLRVPGVEVEDVDTTAKTLPGFTALWTAMLAAGPGRAHEALLDLVRRDGQGWRDAEHESQQRSAGPSRLSSLPREPSLAGAYRRGVGRARRGAWPERVEGERQPGNWERIVGVYAKHRRR